MAACRFCRQPIRWETTRNGKGMPIDPEPRDDGNVVLRQLSGGAGTVAHVLAAGELPLEGELRYRPHFSRECPNRNRQRR